MATVPFPIGVGGLFPHATLIPELVKIDGTNMPEFGWAFTQNDQLSCRFMAWNFGAAATTISVAIDWYTRSASTSGSAVWGGALCVVTPGDAQSMETDAFATENTQSTTVNGTARGPNRTIIVCSNLDGLVANDSVQLRIRRTDASVTGDLILIDLNLSWSDT